MKRLSIQTIVELDPCTSYAYRRKRRNPCPVIYSVLHNGNSFSHNPVLPSEVIIIVKISIPPDFP